MFAGEIQKQTPPNETQSTKSREDFRIYDAEPLDRIQKRVKNHYFNQHRFQSVEFVKNMHKKWLQFDHAEMEVLECLDLLSNWIDESDPDVDVPNTVHAYQTAERLREAHQHKPWLHLVGLIHDMGKAMSVWGEHQWAVTGDTYPVGCHPSESIVYGIESFAGNDDLNDSVYSAHLGMYKEGCGLDSLLMAWGHDEYLYQVLKNHKTTLPEEALHAIRFHSFYPYHTHKDYRYFQSGKDRQMFSVLMELNECDLYSKSDYTPDVDSLKGYYQSLIDIYIPGKVKW